MSDTGNPKHKTEKTEEKAKENLKYMDLQVWVAADKSTPESGSVGRSSSPGTVRKSGDRTPDEKTDEQSKKERKYHKKKNK